MMRGPCFFVFVFLLFTTTEICFGSTEVGIFLPGKKHFMLGKQSGKK